MKTKLSKAAQQQLQYEANEQLLCRLLPMTHEQMNQLIYEQGMSYLATQCRGDEYGISLLAGEAFYWSWWSLQWQARNAEFIALNDLQNGEETDSSYDWAVNQYGQLVARDLRGSYLHYHELAMNNENLCKSYSHIVASSREMWLPKVFNHSKIKSK